jgi:hypothetical protein
MSVITESQLRRAIRAQIIRTLTEADTSADSGKSNRVDLTAIAEDVREEMHKHELERLESMDKEIEKHMPRELPKHAKAVAALKSGASLVRVMGRGAKDGKPMHLIIRAVDGAPMQVAVVKSRSQKGAVRDVGTRVFLFDSEQELQSFLDSALKKHDMKVSELKMVSLGAHTETGETSYGYMAALGSL